MTDIYTVKGKAKPGGLVSMIGIEIPDGQYVALSDFRHELANAQATVEMAMARVEALEAEKARLREALTSMLYIFDRGLESGTIGRMRCDEAREALNANP